MIDKLIDNGRYSMIYLKLMDKYGFFPKFHHTNWDLTMEKTKVLLYFTTKHAEIMGIQQDI